VRWFRADARELPWRESIRDPYRTLVSEIMLQQTQVERVVPFFDRFVARFPDLATLAAAPEGEVLAMWSGLGYYRRARLLHRLASVVVEEHGGTLPESVSGLKALPGIGPYTASAVASLVHGVAAPVLDGNVRRVGARRLSISGDVRGRSASAVIWQWVRDLMAEEEPGCVNEALMELGARVCVPKNPRCGICPLSGSCVARKEGTTELLPKPKNRRAVEYVEWVVACCVTDEGKWLLRRVESGPILRDLWLPPFAELEPGSDVVSQAAALTEHARGEGRVGTQLRHSITYRRIDVLPVFFRAVDRPLSAATWQFEDPRRLEGGTSSLLLKLMRSEFC
jgi:A/G-specific adenine glycosylase